MSHVTEGTRDRTPQMRQEVGVEVSEVSDVSVHVIHSDDALGWWSKRWFKYYVVLDNFYWRASMALSMWLRSREVRSRHGWGSRSDQKGTKEDFHRWSEKSIISASRSLSCMSHSLRVLSDQSSRVALLSSSPFLTHSSSVGPSAGLFDTSRTGRNDENDLIEMVMMMLRIHSFRWIQVMIILL